MIHQTQQYGRMSQAWAGAKIAGNLVRKKPVIFNLNVNVTNACNQQCPMCNAELESKDSSFLTAKDFGKYLEKLRVYRPASCTISGGEPTIVPELPEIIERSAKFFPYGVAINSNFYSGNKRFKDNMIAALKHGIRISVSFDAFKGNADRQRGAKDVERKTLENMEWVSEKKKELGSKSMLIVHTVISDITINDVLRVFDLSAKMGYEQRIAPAVNFYYQSAHPDAPGVKATPKLKEILDAALNDRKLKQNPHFIKGIWAYANGRAPKLCPYTTRLFKTEKVFLDPNGDVALCDRMPIGNLNNEKFEDMLHSDIYAKKQADHEKCPGCWMGCFVEPVLTMKRKERKEIDRVYDSIPLPAA